MKEAITRLIVAVVLMANAILTAKGKNPLPLDENMVTGIISDLIAGGALVWAWWKNNNVTKEAQEAQEYLKWLKSDDNEEV